MEFRCAGPGILPGKETVLDAVKEPVFRRSIVDKAIKTMSQKYGLDVAAFDETFLLKTIERRSEITSCENPETYTENLEQDRIEAQTLYSSLHISYTKFFRDSMVYSLLENQVLPVLAAERMKDTRRELRVWSAGCSSGAEAWTLAILLDELALAFGNKIFYHIFASDISETELTVARAGVYNKAAIENVTLKRLENYFIFNGSSYTVLPFLKDRVDFSFYDLLENKTTCPPESIYGGFDLVVCCNVLLYYRPKAQSFILEKLQSCLNPGGYFVTTEAEINIIKNFGKFRAVSSNAALFKNP